MRISVKVNTTEMQSYYTETVTCSQRCGYRILISIYIHHGIYQTPFPQCLRSISKSILNTGSLGLRIKSTINLHAKIF